MEMNIHQRIPVESKEGVTIYGRVINNAGKMGLYEVFSDYWGTNGEVYHKYADAEKRAKSLIDRHHTPAEPAKTHKR